ncbi:glycoside hydrolase family 35 [Cellulomonas fimi ATCC 484]|uniref:Glycoside hydrolase family 35 n=1 Tax=Cellulomonas fimi (strain ATCC 484 / DSM 20113 / JCM 1341 / CCUG 24087 / LMG 16345 / NBRC 15513 / NCIMB 8980 / NCTC 7547 / NRS-133) TaxID=590998 RepID=F4H3R9_CELFA|nr:glycoside hydrolase family 35 [Cellulomonas fimi ATCC 484]VEH36899.1 Beta-galactosidase precursor [Cellulomonas fimi]
MTVLDTRPGLTTSGLVLDGQEQVLLCASLFYFRLPRETWADRLAQVRASGYTVIDVYLPWNFHELAPGEWDFAGRRDAGAFLDLAHEAGLSVIARPGPYICSEWDGGALPAWLPLTPGLRIRQAEPQYLDAVRGWFDQVLPLLAARQHGHGGSVVAVQLENELDFFDTADRTAYVGALRDMALAHGIEVPLIACAGQGDAAGATGDVEGVVPAFNFYPSDASAFVEPEVRRYAELLAGRGLPLLVTETNRAHVTLRRLLVSGARVLAPYLQASGYDFGWTPSTGNWGDPGGFMTHDYDFGGYLSPVGEPRPEMVEARVLAAVTRTLGARLARAVPHAADDAYRTDVPTSASPSVLALDGGGTLLGVPNLGDVAGPAVLAAGGGGRRALADVADDDLVVTLRPHSCTLVLRDLPLDGFGLDGTLVLATADLVGAGPDGLVLAAHGPSTLALRSGDGTPVVVRLDAPVPGSPASVDVSDGATTWHVVVQHPQDVTDPDGTRHPAPAGPSGRAAVAHAAATAARITAARLLDLPTRTGVTVRHDLPPASEQVGVLRGRTHYTADVTDVTELLLVGAADLVDLALDGQAQPTRARFGATELVPVDGATRVDATVETWGHPNFDDVRLPAMRMGSLRGIGQVFSVTGREDVHALWTVDGGSQWAGEPAPLRTLGGWSSTRVGQPITYRRRLDVDGTSPYALHVDGLPGSARVHVDGVERLVTATDPWVHLAPGEGREITVTVPHAPGAFGPTTLLRLEPVRGWDVEAQSDHDLLALAGSSAGGAPVDLPLALDPGDERWVDVDVPSGGCSIRFEGTHVRVAVYAHDELLGRVWLDDDARPRFTGGDPGRVWLPAAWNGGTIRLQVRATAGRTDPALVAVLVTPSKE